MSQLYYTSSSSSSTASLTTDDPADSDTGGLSDYEVASSGIQTPSEAGSVSFSLDDSIVNISRALSNFFVSEATTEDNYTSQNITEDVTPLASGAATPRVVPPPVDYEALGRELYERLQSQNSLNDLADKLREKLSIPSPRTHAHQNASALINANLSRIQSDPRGWGFKFIAMCVCCAYGGRRGLNRYDERLASLQIKSIFGSLDRSGSLNFQGALNVHRFCYLGHVILYYWSLGEDTRRALTARFGNRLRDVIESRGQIVREIGSEHLWAEKEQFVGSYVKAKIIADIKRKFPLDKALFEEIMANLGVQL